MGSINESERYVNLLEYLRSRTQVDCDSLDIQIVTELGPFVDCTSNQADSYFELLNPRRAALLKKSADLSRHILPEYPDVSFEELAVEISMISLSLTIAPLIPGNIHVMANPSLSYSTPKVIQNGQRIASLCQRLDPSFDLSRLCIKVPATWEGLQACRKLKDLGIKTLATTLFTMEQAILAAEAGCISISPFVHELRVHFDEEYHDTDPIFDLCVKAQQYFERYSYATRVKACSLISVDEVMQVAGVAALTLPPTLLHPLSEMTEPEAKVAALSLFNHNTKIEGQEMERRSFLDEEARFRETFAKRDGGKGRVKTTQAIDLFCEYQLKAEALMKDTDTTIVA
ncbi:hypothetical protein EPUS_09152 [Endocarpon pusillum Z07020]|uniref:Transaldolase n=1 Tax=Endocarpon pusillum (strain Z07020 / HMAS-L-300199) TaxID=1263415 RepID=U1HUZ9_ENDPU|nr:uncharacterized protein EPUS_09152 [Endocarpon pusillum Z07020]ERF73134.1 hypothetical protein EPUS_09152 [Endocarpon pusillum Z07020]